MGADDSRRQIVTELARNLKNSPDSPEWFRFAPALLNLPDNWVGVGHRRIARIEVREKHAITREVMPGSQIAYGYPH